jgi:CheY-like chemotaxis protein
MINECHPRKDGGVNSAPRVLVIDGTSDTGAVLKAVLEPRGTQVERTRGLSGRRRQDELATPHIVVIDLDDESANESTSCFGESHRILIGSVKTPVDDRDRFLAKPFQYPELLRAIEDLLALPPAG